MPDRTWSKAFLYCLVALWCSEIICFAWQTKYLLVLKPHNNGNLFWLGAWKRNSCLGQAGIGGPAVVARDAGTVEVILVPQFSLSLLPSHHSIVIPIVIKNLIACLQTPEVAFIYHIINYQLLGISSTENYWYSNRHCMIIKAKILHEDNCFKRDIFCLHTK